MFDHPVHFCFYNRAAVAEKLTHSTSLISHRSPLLIHLFTTNTTFIHYFDFKSKHCHWKCFFIVILFFFTVIECSHKCNIEFLIIECFINVTLKQAIYCKAALKQNALFIKLNWKLKQEVNKYSGLYKSLTLKNKNVLTTMYLQLKSTTFFFHLFFQAEGRVKVIVRGKSTSRHRCGQ